MRVPDMEHAVTAALKLVEKTERRDAMAQAALAFASSNRGAAERTAAALLAIAERAANAEEASPPPEERTDPSLD